MIHFETIKTREQIILPKELYDCKRGLPQQIALFKSAEPNKECFYLKLKTNKKEEIIDIGYMYFYLDYDRRESSYIGSFIQPDYRNEGLSSLLTAYWIQICMDQGFTSLKTNRKQKKPFLLYLLKKFDFEISEIERYERALDTIYLYKEKESLQKHLKFKNENQAISFSKSSIMQTDNYQILEEVTPEFQFVDQVLLSNIYYLQNAEKAYKRALTISEKYQY